MKEIIAACIPTHSLLAGKLHGKWLAKEILLTETKPEFTAILPLLVIKHSWSQTPMPIYMLTDYHFDTWFLSKNTNFPLGTLNGLLSIDSKELACLFVHVGIALVAQMVKHLPTMRETWVQSLGREDPLEK